MNPVLTHEQAKKFYDHFGAKQDMQRFYEDRAVRKLEDYADLGHALSVVEFGCGTGRLAQRLLERRLSSGATYLGVDVSSTMVKLARRKLAPWVERAHVEQTDGTPKVPLSDGECDRFLSVYVLDLMSPEEARGVIAEARRVLEPHGRLCLASLTFGQHGFSRAVSRLWTAVQNARPALVGGCRPIALNDYMDARWRVIHHEVVSTWGVSTEILIAEPAGE
jgi:ubiquinone/menaquinone biosynthesis C-methylase UbiE